MSLDNQGRDHGTGCFVAGADLFVDMLVQDNRNLWFAIEIDGPNHKRKDVRKRDAKKSKYLKERNVPVIRLPWKKKKKES